MTDECAIERTICVIATDHTLAPVDVRSAFTLTRDELSAALPALRERLGATGIALLSTCNRVELWASFDGVPAPRSQVDCQGRALPEDEMLQALCAAHGLDHRDFAEYFTVECGDAAVSRLFQVACGLRSAIVAEDQIVSQVKQAIVTARKLDVADSCLEVLFRQAITTAKKVKSGVRFSRAHATAVDQAIALLRSEGVDVERASCLVIGNGEYGRLAASKLVACGARVTMTVRQYSHGSVKLPEGCEGIPYDQRYECLDGFDVVMSATTSPHFTLECDAVVQARAQHRPLWLFDLAVPRDIDTALADEPGCRLYSIDDFGTDMDATNDRALAAAHKILREGKAEFWDWVHRRDVAYEHPPVGAFFPMFVNLNDKHAVFVGGGTIALRRVRTLLPFVSDIVVYAPDFSPELERFAVDGALTLVEQKYEPCVLDGADLVFACTNDSELNDQIRDECKRRGILVNVCSDRFKCDFHFPGVATAGNVVVGVSAGGKDHRRVKQVRARIQELLDEEDL